MNLRQRLHQWFSARITPRDSMLLTQRNVYIVPSRAGWMLGLTMLVLLIASINYQLNLGYLLTFMLAGCATAGMHVCHGNLRGLTLHLSTPESPFAGAAVRVKVQLTNAHQRRRYGIGVAIWDSDQWSWTDVDAHASAGVELAFQALHRGLHPIPTITAQTRYPLGTFRVWTLWRPAARVLVYPAPEANPPPMPQGEPRGRGAVHSQSQATQEYDGARPYRRGDPRKLILWKKAAKADTLVSRDAALSSPQWDLWLDLDHAGPHGRAAAAGGIGLEKALSRLCAWVLQADAQGLRYGLRLGALVLPADTGAPHKLACLRALAQYAPGTSARSP